jgi:hypothetical protein
LGTARPSTGISGLDPGQTAHSRCPHRDQQTMHGILSLLSGTRRQADIGFSVPTAAPSSHRKASSHWTWGQSNETRIFCYRDEIVLGNAGD